MQGYRFNKVAGVWDIAGGLWKSYNAVEDARRGGPSSLVPNVVKNKAMDLGTHAADAADKSLNVLPGDSWFDPEHERILNSTIDDLNNRMETGKPIGNTTLFFRRGYQNPENLTHELAERNSSIAAAHVKANLRWKKDPRTGNFVPATEDEIRHRVSNLIRSSSVEPAKAPSVSGKRPEYSDLVASKVEGAIEDQVKLHAKENPLSGAPMAVSLWLERNGYPELARWASKPGVFWGAVGAGAIGIPMLVRSFLGGGNKQQNPNITVNVNTQGQGVPTTTSYYRYRPE